MFNKGHFVILFYCLGAISSLVVCINSILKAYSCYTITHLNKHLLQADPFFKTCYYEMNYTNTKEEREREIDR